MCRIQIFIGGVSCIFMGWQMTTGKLMKRQRLEPLGMFGGMPQRMLYLEARKMSFFFQAKVSQIKQNHQTEVEY